jgi:hypothetical protein
MRRANRLRKLADIRLPAVGILQRLAEGPMLDFIIAIQSTKGESDEQ